MTDAAHECYARLLQAQQSRPAAHEADEWAKADARATVNANIRRRLPKVA